MLKKTSVKAQALGHFNHPLDDWQHSGIDRLNNGMEDRVPRHIWQEASVDAMAALLTWQIIDAGIVTLDSLNTQGLYAWRYAEEKIREGAQTLAGDDGVA